MPEEEKTRESREPARSGDDAMRKATYAVDDSGLKPRHEESRNLAVEQTRIISQLENDLRVAKRQSEEALRKLDLAEREKAEIEATLDTVLQSTGWRFLQKFRRFRSRFLPPGSRRSRLCDLVMLRFATTPEVGSSGPADRSIHSPDCWVQLALPGRFEALPDRPSLSCSIIIPVLNRSIFTKACLLAIERSISGDEIPYEVIVVDNGSTDDTRALLSAWSQSRANARVVRMSENTGFAHACNEGARIASGEYIVLLNNDTLPTPGWLQKMMSLAVSETSVGIVGSKLLFPDGRLQHIGVAFDEGKNPSHIYRGFPSDIRPAKLAREYQAVTGACLLVERNLFWSVGGLDEAYKNSYEDIDLCLKLRARGWRVLFCADSTLYHFESMSYNRHGYDFRNRALLKARWAGDILCDLREWYARDGFGEASTQFEGNRTLHSEQETRLKDLWRKVYRGPYPEAELITVSSGLRNG